MKIIVNESVLEIRFSILEKIAGVHGSFKISLDDITATHTTLPAQSLKEVRLPGTHLPGLIKAGTYLTDRGKEFWFTTKKQQYLVIELENNPYKRIVLSIDNHDELKDKIDGILKRK